MNSLRLVVLMLSLLFIGKLSAQFEKGTLQIGGDVTSDMSIWELSAINWRIEPEVSYFFQDNFSLGISGQFYNRFNSFQDFNSRFYNLGLLSRYYFYQKGPLALNGEAYMGGGERILSSESKEYFNRRSGTMILGMGVGVSYHIHPNIALTSSYRISQNVFMFEDRIRVATTGGLRFGLRANLNRRK